MNGLKTDIWLSIKQGELESSNMMFMTTLDGLLLK